MKDKGKVLVLGANGFIGSHVVDSLVAAGYEIRAFDNFKDKKTRFNNSDSIELFSGNFLNKGDIVEALKGIDYVFHLVSTTNPVTAEADPLIDIDTNIRGSVELLRSCVVESNIKRVLYASSGGTIYGERIDSKPFSEDELTLPISPYGIGKLTVENYLHYFKVRYGLNFTAFRIANPYGERQPHLRKQGVIPIFLENIMNDTAINVMGDGSMVRDYLYVKDVASMMVETLEYNPKNNIYNLGSGSGHSLTEIIEEIESVTNKKARIDRLEVPATFVHTSVLGMDRYFTEFGKRKMVNLHDGIKLTYNYLKAIQEN